MAALIAGSIATLAGYALGWRHGRLVRAGCAARLGIHSQAAAVGVVAAEARRFGPYPCELVAGHAGPHKHGKPGTPTGEVTWW
jgi:hypothetical protein